MRCPTCRKNTPFDGNPHRPFCSERCKLIDLGKWAAGAYRVPDQPAGDLESPPGEPNERGSGDVERT